MEFSVFEQVTPINRDLEITIVPNSSYLSYKCIIYKDDVVYNQIVKDSTLINTNISLHDTGHYKIDIVYSDSFSETVVSSGVYNIDKEVPVLSVGDTYIEMDMGAALDIMGGVSATDNFSGEITSRITTNSSILDFTTSGVKRLIYTVSDEASNTVSHEVVINVKRPASGLLVYQGFFIFALLIIMIAIIIYNRGLRLEKRISKFAISPIKDNTVSLFESWINRFYAFNSKINKILCKSVFIKKYSDKYKKYVNSINEVNTSGIDFVSNKVLISIIFLIIAIFAKTIQLKVFKLHDIYLPVIGGFFLPDILYYIKYKNYKRKLDNDLLQSIIIMNNAFKSGRSIIQAIELVSRELDGVMGLEFKKMYLELSFGLSIDVVFNRFKDRIETDEVAYLTASLTILNQTGGDITRVFDSIEKSMFSKKKLRLELNSLTASSRMIVNILIFVPFIFMLFINIVSPGYFLPLFTSPIGYIIIGLMIIYYIIYVVFVRKVLKVKI